MESYRDGPFISSPTIAYDALHEVHVLFVNCENYSNLKMQKLHHPTFVAWLGFNSGQCQKTRPSRHLLYLTCSNFKLFKIPKYWLALLLEYPG